MAKSKKSTKKKAAAAGLQAQAEQLSRRLGESAQQVWLAGVGAFGRAQAEGGKLFETLVKEGVSLEQATRKLGGARVEAVREAVESTVGQARERAAGTWDRLEKVFEERVQGALRRLEVPSRDDLATLADRVDELTAELRRRGARAAAPRTASARKSPAKAAKKAAPAAKKAARKAPRKAAS